MTLYDTTEGCNYYGWEPGLNDATCRLGQVCFLFILFILFTNIYRFIEVYITRDLQLQLQRSGDIR